jgi:DNA-binding GntR family transcriptional regulator
LSKTGNKRGEKGPSIADRLSVSITAGRFAPGQRLVEAELTAELGSSRGPVREALRKLQADGLVELVPNKGAIVRRLSLREAIELFEIRTELEALAAGKAAANMADTCVRARFDHETAEIWRKHTRNSTAGYIAENQSFHSAIFSASLNRQLSLLNHRLQLSLIMAQIAPALTADTILNSLTEHRGIATAILDRDSRSAETLSRAHMCRAIEVVRSMPPTLFRLQP